MTVQTLQLLQDGGAPEYIYHDRTAWRCAFFVGKKYGNKGYPQSNAAHMAAFLCGYPLLHPYFLPTKNAQRHAVLSWYIYPGASPSCNSCYVCTVMRIPIVVRHNKSRWCCYLEVTVSRT